MTGGGLRLVVLGAMLLLWVGAAFGASAAKPVPGTFSGTYKVTIKVTNTKQKPLHWIYASHPTCSSPCHKLSFRIRQASDKSWLATMTLHWNGKAYHVVTTYPNYADCVSKSGATVKKGYDVTGTKDFVIRTVKNGHVVRWVGTGKDSYDPNAKGREHHCKWGAYDYAFTGVAQ